MLKYYTDTLLLAAITYDEKLIHPSIRPSIHIYPSIHPSSLYSAIPKVWWLISVSVCPLPTFSFLHYVLRNIWSLLHQRRKVSRQMSWSCKPYKDVITRHQLFPKQLHLNSLHKSSTNWLLTITNISCQFNTTQSERITSSFHSEKSCSAIKLTETCHLLL